MRYLFLAALFIGVSTANAQFFKRNLTNIPLNKLSEDGLMGNPVPQSSDMETISLEDFQQGTDETFRPTERQKEDFKKQKFISNQQFGDTQVFGSSWFRSGNFSFVPDTRTTATPQDYILGPGDRLVLSIYGDQVGNFEAEVTAQGSINIPYIGFVSVSGLNILQAKTKLVNLLARNGFSTLRSGASHLELLIREYRSINIAIIGAKNPGNYRVNALSTVFYALYMAGGPEENGSYRQIELLRNNQVVEVIDLYDFLLHGSLEANRHLKENDVIRIPKAQNRVLLMGEIKTPAVYELLEGETMATLLNMAGGFTDYAYQERMFIERVGKLGYQGIEVSKNDYASFFLLSGDKIYVSSILNRLTNRVSISGAVMRPGYYEWKDGLSLQELISRAEGFREDALSTRGLIYRNQRNNINEYIAFDPSALDSTGLILLQDGDSVIVGSLFKFFPHGQVTVLGEVQNPGLFTYAPGMKLTDAIFLAGGFQTGAKTEAVIVSRIVKDPIINANQQRQELEINLPLDGREVALEEGDLIVVKHDPNYRPLEFAFLQGEFKEPGPFVLMEREETVQKALSRLGGFGSLAHKESFKILRQRYISMLDDSNHVINVVKYDTIPMGKWSESGRMLDKFQVLPGDVLKVDMYNNTVDIQGAVFRPGIRVSQKKSVRWYVHAAGGVTHEAQLKKAFVRYIDGSVKSTRNFVFFKIYPTVKAGSVVFVPQKIEKEESSSEDKDRQMRLWLSASSVLSSLTTTAFLIYSIMQ